MANELRWCQVLPCYLLLLPLLLSFFSPDLLCKFCASFSHVLPDCMIRSCFFPAASVDVTHLHVTLAHILNLKCGHPLGWESIISSPYSMSLGILLLSMHLTWPSQYIQHCKSKLCMPRVPVCCRTLVLDSLSFHVIPRMYLKQQR